MPLTSEAKRINELEKYFGMVRALSDSGYNDKLIKVLNVCDEKMKGKPRNIDNIKLIKPNLYDALNTIKYVNVFEKIKLLHFMIEDIKRHQEYLRLKYPNPNEDQFMESLEWNESLKAVSQLKEELHRQYPQVAQHLKHPVRDYLGNDFNDPVTNYQKSRRVRSHPESRLVGDNSNVHRQLSMKGQAQTGHKKPKITPAEKKKKAEVHTEVAKALNELAISAEKCDPEELQERIDNALGVINDSLKGQLRQIPYVFGALGKDSSAVETTKSNWDYYSEDIQKAAAVLKKLIPLQKAATNCVVTMDYLSENYPKIAELLQGKATLLKEKAHLTSNKEIQGYGDLARTINGALSIFEIENNNESQRVMRPY